MTIEDELAEAIERYRVRENLSLREALERLLRAGFQVIESKPVSKPFVGETFDMGLMSGIDPNRFNQLADEIEAEEFAR